MRLPAMPVKNYSKNLIAIEHDTSQNKDMTIKNNCPHVPDQKDPHFSCAYSSGRGIIGFQQMVLTYYHQYGRDMPWRITRDPYHILVSEIMLQQTQVERVTKKFPEFIRAFPDFTSLASASLADILAVWQGMGYNRRAVALQKCAIRVVTEYHGNLPDSAEILSTFPGIGRATAGSIAAFAFNVPVVFIETNIRRVYIHFFFPHAMTIGDDKIYPLVEQTLFRENPRVWYWALMDLGAALKKTGINPNRRSAHYSRQSPFEGSDRKIRGRILKILLEEHILDEEEFCVRLSEDHRRVTRILQALESEEFIRRTESGYILKN
jgi:A/G-specific adenine glycosylase